MVIIESINVLDIKKEVTVLNKLIVDYENNFLNLYNELNKLCDYWQDVHATSFYKELELKKIEVRTAIEEIKSIQNIYDYVQDRYGIFGKKIIFDLSYKNEVISNIDSYILGLKEVMNDYLALDLSFCPFEAKYINNEILKLKQNINNLIAYKDNINKKFNYIVEVEKNIKLKISKIQVSLLKKLDISDFV